MRNVPKANILTCPRLPIAKSCAKKVTEPCLKASFWAMINAVKPNRLLIVNALRMRKLTFQPVERELLPENSLASSVTN